MATVLTYDLPTARDQYAAAYDSDREVLVLFGGFDGTNPVGETWEYDGVNWTSISTGTAPTARFNASMVYDANRKTMVLFGGDDGTNPSAETWEYNGTNWSLKSPTASPAARHTFGLVFDSDRDVIVLFGGIDASQVYNDTWEYDGTTWAQVTTTTSPSARTVHSLAYDANQKKTVLYGGLVGFGSPTVNGETWEYDGTDWAQQSPSTSPPLLTGSGMDYDASSKKVVLFGGTDDSSVVKNETWVYDEGNWVQIAFASTDLTPDPSYGFRLVYDSSAKRMILFGGTASPTPSTVFVNQDTWEYKSSTLWEKLPPLFSSRAVTVDSGARPASNSFGWVALAPSTPPSARTRSASVYDSARRRVVLFGGMGAAVRADDTWEFNGYEWDVQSPALDPAARDGHSLAFDSLRSRVVLFGGLGNSGELNDTLVYNGVNWTLLAPGASPPIRRGASMAYDADRDRVVLFGGIAGSTPLNDTWEFDGSTWAQITPTTSPSARHSSLGAYDAHRKMFVLFGGEAAGPTTLAETWEYDGNSWYQRTPATSPTARLAGSAVYSPTEKKVFVFGGTDGSSANYDDTWKWDGSTWEDVTVTALKPSARDGSSLAYDGNRDALILHGGGVLEGVGSLSDTLGHPGTRDPKVIGPELIASGPLTAFSATVTATAPDAVNFVLAVNGVQRWHNGTSWVRSDGSFAESTSADDINTNAATLDLSSGDTFQVLAVIHTDTGLTFPEVDTVTITFGTSPTSPTAPTSTTISENALGSRAVSMAIATVLTAGVVTKILVTLKSVGPLLPSSTTFITNNNLIPEILVRAGLGEDEKFETLTELSTGTQGDLTVTEVELTP